MGTNKFHLWSDTGSTSSALSESYFDSNSYLKSTTFNTIFREASLVSSIITDIAQDASVVDLSVNTSRNILKNNFLNGLSQNNFIRYIPISNQINQQLFLPTNFTNDGVVITDTEENNYKFKVGSWYYITAAVGLSGGSDNNYSFIDFMFFVPATDDGVFNTTSVNKLVYDNQYYSVTDHFYGILLNFENITGDTNNKYIKITTNASGKKFKFLTVHKVEGIEF